MTTPASRPEVGIEFTQELASEAGVCDVRSCNTCFTASRRFVRRNARVFVIRIAGEVLRLCEEHARQLRADLQVHVPAVDRRSAAIDRLVEAGLGTLEIREGHIDRYRAGRDGFLLCNDGSGGESMAHVSDREVWRAARALAALKTEKT